MAPHQKERHAGKLLLEATDEIQRLIQICEHVHDRMLRGDDDMTLMRKLQEGWQGPNDGKVSSHRRQGELPPSPSITSSLKPSAASLTSIVPGYEKASREPN